MIEQGSAVRDAFARHVNPTFVRLLGMLGFGRVWTRAEGFRVTDANGASYVDLLAGFGSMNLGHNDPELRRALIDALEAQPMHVCHVGATPHEAAAAERLVRAAGEPFAIAMMSSSGAEAVEAALKLARAATRRPGIVYCRGGFHGLSLGTLSIMGAPRLRAPFEPLLQATAVPFADLAALRKALASRTQAAFVVEPIQAEAGVIVPPPGYLAEARALCAAHGTLLVFDEVQTGLGRTGARFAFQREGVVPDVLVLGKSLGAGIVPAAATLCSADVHEAGYGGMDRFDAHGSTFAGNPLACAAAIATLDRLDRDQLAERARTVGAHLLDRLRARIAGHPLVRGIRGRGMLIGIELGSGASSALAGATAWLSERAPRLGRLAPPPFIGQWIALRMLEAGFLCQPSAHDWDVLKLAPPLAIPIAELDRAVDALAGILDEYRGATAVLRDVGVRMAARGVKGWAW